jgi:hypothetical protein
MNCCSLPEAVCGNCDTKREKIEGWVQDYTGRRPLRSLTGICGADGVQTSRKLTVVDVQILGTGHYLQLSTFGMSGLIGATPAQK